MSTNIAPITETVTKEQLGRAADRFISKSFKNASTMPKDIVQKVLDEEVNELAQEMYEVLRTRVERRAKKLIVRRVTVNRDRKPTKAMFATKRIQYVDDSVIMTMPKGEGVEVDVYFFDLDYDPTADQLDREMELRSLKPDPIALAAVNEADPAFADDRPNVTQWRDKKGNACFVLFRRRSDERNMVVRRDGDFWALRHRFSGVRK